VTNSKGILIFAYNSKFDYVKIANACAALTKKYINLPVTLVTNKKDKKQANQNFIDNIIEFDSIEVNKRVFVLDHGANTETLEWKNMTRFDAYELSPYDQTLLIDCDYLVLNDNLAKLFETDLEFTCYDHVHDITNLKSFDRDKRLGHYSIPMLWATVIYFTKCEYSKAIFDMMRIVKENYMYYSKVYGFRNAPYRNDFALSIAHHALSGYGHDRFIPFKLPTLSSTADLIKFRPNGEILYQYKTNRMYTGRIHNTDLHVMNKTVFNKEVIRGIMHHAIE